jgi:DNA-binding MarR family transcriptional regulator
VPTVDEPVKKCGRTVKPRRAHPYDELVDALLATSRAVVAMAARSLAHGTGDVTLVQYRVLVELAERGPQRVADLAGALGVEPSTVTRMCDRLERKDLILRERSARDRRSVWISLRPQGRALVDHVTRRRRLELARIVACLPNEGRRPVLAALRAFTQAAGEAPEQHWSLGWR